MSDPKRVSVQLGDIDGEYCSILECVCGVKYESWENSITIDSEGTTMPCCGRKLFFRAKVFCYEVLAEYKYKDCPSCTGVRPSLGSLGRICHRCDNTGKVRTS